LKDEDSYSFYKQHKKAQSALGTATKAPFIPKEFGDIVFSQLSANQV
jgi:hypothetical protein